MKYKKGDRVQCNYKGEVLIGTICRISGGGFCELTNINPKVHLPGYRVAVASITKKIGEQKLKKYVVHLIRSYYSTSSVEIMALDDVDAVDRAYDEDPDFSGIDTCGDDEVDYVECAEEENEV